MSQEQYQHGQIDHEEWQYAAVEFPQRRVEQGVRGEQVQPERRQEHADGQIDCNDNAEMNRVYARGVNDWC